MTPLLVALAGPSRSGKGTCAEVFQARASDAGLTIRERQLSGPGKQYVADAFRPGITEREAVEWFDEMKLVPQDDAHGRIEVSIGAFVQGHLGIAEWTSLGNCTLQEYLQRMLQGARDRWGSEFWIDKVIPTTKLEGEDDAYRIPSWHFNFPVDGHPAEICLISDLRQVNEAKRVKMIGGLLVEFRRPKIEHSYLTSSSHVTEQALPDGMADYVIENHFTEHNTESLVALQAMCDTAFDWCMARREVAA